MCDKCLEPAAQQQPRNTLWSLPSNIRCAVIGSCLEIPQLKRVANRFRKYTSQVDLDTDYALHSYFVSISADRNPVSSYLNKLLNRQYAEQIRHVRRLKSGEEILEAWNSLDRLDVRALSGYFWAMLSNRHITVAVRDRLYGDIHMISHIAGRNDKLAIYRLLEENQRLSNELLKKDRQLLDKGRKLTDQRFRIDKLEQQKRRLDYLLDQLKTSRVQANPAAERDKARIAAQQLKIQRLEQRLAERRVDGPEAEPAQPLSSAEPAPDAASCDRDCDHCSQRDLCGKTILYVGGFARHRKKFERLTRSMNGQFFYHDGGLQQSEHQLDELIRKADCVFCPVDCVSHSAINRIKNLSRRAQMDCVFLKSASISSFRQEVMRYAS